MPTVSVIITTRNEEKNIGNCLESLKTQTFRDFEIIVVDNNSTDKTKDIAASYTSQIFNLGPERSSQRNYGVALAKAPFILYLDADMIMSPQVIEECVGFMKNPQVHGVYIPEKIVGSGFWIDVRNFERSFYDGTVIDAIRFVRKESFEAVGGFDPKLCGPEDWDFDKRIRQIGQVVLGRAHIMHNEGAFNLPHYLKKKSYYSQSFDAYIQKWDAKDLDIKKQLGVFYRFLGVYIEDGKFIKILRHPLLALGMYYLRFRVGLAFLQVKQRNRTITQSAS